MRITKIVCDRCGTEIEGYPIKMIPEYVSRKNEDLTAECGDIPVAAFPIINKEFCVECTNKINRYALGGMKVNEEFEKAVQEMIAGFPSDETEEECNSGGGDTDAGEEQKKTRVKIDTGKVAALKMAGWSVKQIAENLMYQSRLFIR